jgi:isopentenyl-diphosphate delta-isomerase
MTEVFVILVDEQDNQIGLMQKTEAHQKALLHRAISVFICNSRGEWLLHRRALDKYHSSGLWTNTCCSHPLPGETSIDAANRRLKEEMGMECHLDELFSFTYKEALDNDLTEHEFDHVFSGISDIIPIINPDEVHEFKYMKFNDLRNDVGLNPHNYTVWFRKIFERVEQHFSNPGYE